MDYSVLFYSWINSEEYKIRDSKKTIQKQIDYGFDGDIRSSVVEKYDASKILFWRRYPSQRFHVGWMDVNKPTTVEKILLILSVAAGVL